MKPKEFIIINDFAIGEVYLTEYDSSIVSSYEEYYEILNNEHDLNLSDSNCQCMIVNERLVLNFL